MHIYFIINKAQKLKVCCFSYEDLMRITTTGASMQTSSQDNYNISGMSPNLAPVSYFV